MTAVPPVLPNALSLLRVALLVPVLVSLYGDGDGVSTTTLVLLALAGLTDILDGLLARNLGQASRLGRIFDPVCDKIFIGGVVVGLVLWRDFPAWLLTAQLLRDVAILGAGAVLLRRRQLVVPASWLGKAATWSMGLLILTWVVGRVQPVADILVYGAAGLLALSSLDYLRVLYRIVHRGRRG